MDSRGLTQVQMEELSTVDQSTISKILKKQMVPSAETLTRLFDALGLKLEHVLQELAATSNEIIGYLATPLTNVATGKADAELRRAVDRIKAVAGQQQFSTAPSSFQLYWPGDHTHPVSHSHFTPEQVYLIDRSRASTFDFLVLLCAEPSYGVGQENEIATQAGLPAVRILPKKTSRMIVGSFLLAKDVAFEGNLHTGLKIDETALGQAFGEVRRIYLRHRILHGPRTGLNFGQRLRSLINDRSGDYAGFAEELDKYEMRTEKRRLIKLMRRAGPRTLRQAVERYVEWEVFAFWARTALEDNLPLPAAIENELKRRCPGFLEAEAVVHGANPREETYCLFDRLVEWIEDHKFTKARKEGWFDVLRYQAHLHARHARVTEYWHDWEADRENHPTAQYPGFGEWCVAADRYAFEGNA